MKQPRILTLILAGGAGGRMGVLTQVRAKPALPYGGVYRLIDFPLSNCVHSGLADVWVIEQFQPQSLNDHLANGRPWDLDRTYGGLRLIPPHQGTPEGGFAEGNADAIFRNIRQIREFGPDLILVLSADHIYKLDYTRVVDAHLQYNADVTMVVTHMPIAEAGRFGVVELGDEGRVVGFEYKPDSPRSDVVTTEIFVYNTEKLLATLDELAGEGAGGDGEPALKDFGHELLPRLVQEGRAYAYLFDGYWRDVGVVDSYWRSHMDLLEPTPPLSLDEPGWPTLTYGFHRRPAHIHASARIENSLIAPGCEVRGHVVNSVLAPGVVVAEGAEVHNAIIFHDTVVERGARVEFAILDREVRIEARASVGDREQPDGEHAPAIAVVGERAHLPEGMHIRAGGVVEPGGSAEADAKQ
ncbi:MAG TPA: glucose-1-phosphate adenylyltransferase family protein [Herpetosiphonaceae bacterium]|nr:glucose-1-phosphate adenylyltransferase family protein [Herpetosiphonaceae bacterium]